MSSLLPFSEVEDAGFRNLSVTSNGLCSDNLTRSRCNAMRSSFLPKTSHGCGSTFSTSHSNPEKWDSTSVSTISEVISRANSTFGWILSKSTSSISQLKRAPSWLPKKRSGCKRSSLKSLNGRKPVLLRKVPFGKSSKYMTVYVGTRIEQSAKFVISRSLLVHPLFQVLIKCSEDEFGEDYAVKNGVALVCDVALFLQVVRAVDDSLWCAKNSQDHGLEMR